MRSVHRFKVSLDSKSNLTASIDGISAGGFIERLAQEVSKKNIPWSIKKSLELDFEGFQEAVDREGEIMLFNCQCGVPACLGLGDKAKITHEGQDALLIEFQFPYDFEFESEEPLQFRLSRSELRKELAKLRI